MRDCENCIHHTSGKCSSWECEEETVEQFKVRVRRETLDELAERYCDTIINIHGDIVTSENVVLKIVEDMKK